MTTKTNLRLILLIFALPLLHCCLSGCSRGSRERAAAVSHLQELLRAGGCGQYLIGTVDVENRNVRDRADSREQGIKSVQHVGIHYAVAGENGQFSAGRLQQYFLANGQFHPFYAARNGDQDKILQTQVIDNCFKRTQTQATGGPGRVSLSSCSSSGNINVSCGPVTGSGALAVSELTKSLKTVRCRRYLLGSVEVSNLELGPGDIKTGIKSKQRVNVYFAYEANYGTQSGSASYLLLDEKVDGSYSKGQIDNILNQCAK
jgi:hypothetical protein